MDSKSTKTFLKGFFLTLPMEENKSAEKEHKNSITKKDVTEKMRKNPWILSTLILGVVVLILLVGNFGTTGNSVSENEAGKIILDFANSQVEGAELVSVEKDSGLYKVTLALDGNDIPLYLTLDGKNLVSGLTPLSLLEQPQEQETETTAIPKTDKPVVELFIWSYCPYGVQAQGPLAEVATLLGDSADFKAILYYDGHGAYETQQNKIQACIQQIAPKKYWDYAAGFVKNIYPNCGVSKDIECDKTESIKLMNSLQIDSSKVMTCVETQGEALIKADAQRASTLGVTGSPTLAINGVKANTARTSEAFKTAICESFNTVPSKCSTTLTATAAATSGNC